MRQLGFAPNCMIEKMLEALNTAIEAYIVLEDDGLGDPCAEVIESFVIFL